MRPITKLQLASLRVRESGTPFSGVRWVMLPDDHLVKIGEKVRVEVSYDPITDGSVDNIFNMFMMRCFPPYYLKVTNTKFIWETTAQESEYVDRAKAGVISIFRMFQIHGATCEVYGTGSSIEWKWLLIGIIVIGGVAIGYTLKK